VDTELLQQDVVESRDEDEVPQEGREEREGAAGHKAASPSLSESVPEEPGDADEDGGDEDGGDDEGVGGWGPDGPGD
jgi:hypothetical protein